ADAPDLDADPTEVVEGADDLVLEEASAPDRVVSSAVETGEFETVGLTWPAGLDATGLEAQVRTRTDGVWSDWQTLGTAEPTDQTPDDGTVDDRLAARGGTDALWVGSSDAVQLSTTADAAAAGGLRLALVSAGDVTAPVDARVSTASLGSAVTSPPRVISRAEWGARAPSCTPDVAQQIVGAVVHHTAGSNAYANPAEAMAQIRNDQRYHIESRGWCDIGYNFLVDKFGNIYEGRANSLTQPVIGVHAGGFNTGTVGISMLGDYSTTVPSGAQLDAVGQVAAWRLAAYQVDPRSTITYRTGGGENSRYPAGSVVQLPAIFAHRDTAFTSCPGQAAYDRLGTVRQAATTWYLSWPEWGSGPSVSPQMRLLWDRWGGPDGPIGVPVTGQRCDLAPAGCVQQFTGADVYWSPQTGAQAVGGLILNRYRASGEQAAIGYPTDSVFGCPASGCTQSFQSGVITWSPGTGAQLVGGAVYGRWKASGGLAAGIGYPTTTVLGCDPAAGCTQWFQSGRVTWSGATGAHIIGGILGSTWDALGGAPGSLGYPTSTQLACDPGAGCAQTFSGGVIAWKAATGARAAGAAVAVSAPGSPAARGSPRRRASTAARAARPRSRRTRRPAARRGTAGRWRRSAGCGRRCRARSGRGRRPSAGRPGSR
ncbi:hypothetical protein HF998_11235, partial [Cellulomonas hominis]|nr:hypothetical protein [Cellulomonas hominis]